MLGLHSDEEIRTVSMFSDPITFMHQVIFLNLFYIPTSFLYLLFSHHLLHLPPFPSSPPPLPFTIRTKLLPSPQGWAGHPTTRKRFQRASPSCILLFKKASLAGNILHNATLPICYFSYVPPTVKLQLLLMSTKAICY